MPPPQSATNTGFPSYSNVNCWMKCAGMISPLASLTKPESIGRWISACTSGVSPLEVARTRMVDPISILPVLYLSHDFAGKLDHALSAAFTDGQLDFLVVAVEL